MRRIRIAAVAALALLAGCSGANEPAKVVTVTASPTAASPSAVVTPAPSGMDTDVGQGNLPVAKFGDSVSIPGADLRITLGKPAKWTDPDGYTRPNEFGDHAKSIVRVKMTVQNIGKYPYKDAIVLNGTAGNWDVTSDYPEVPNQIGPGQTETWEYKYGADAKGRLSIEIDDASGDPMAYFTNEHPTPA